MLETVAGLSGAHHQGFVHRDLKPGNILVSVRGTAKLADFGLAKRVLAPGARPLGLADLSGTPHFMAPELFAGEPASRESDVYAAGVSFYYLLTGKLPFSAPSFREVIKKHREEEPPDPRALAPDVPERARRIVGSCLAKRKEDRYPDAESLHEELRSLLGSLRDLDEVVRAALAGSGVEWRPLGPDRFLVEARLERGRRQNVLIEKVESPGAGETLVRIWSPCAPVTESYLRKALELNAEIHHGSISIGEYRETPTFIMANSYPWATCDPEEIRESVSTVARRADEVERALTETDRN